MEERGNPLPVLLPTAVQVAGEIFMGINPSHWNWWEDDLLKAESLGQQI